MSLKKNITKTDIMDIHIKHGNDKIRFKLDEELRIDENRINEELKIQPSYYGFLRMLRTKLKRLREDRKIQMRKVYSRQFLNFKSQTNEDTGRTNSNDIADHLATVSPEYQRAVKNFNKADEDFSTIDDAVESFNQRSSLIQTLSANMREEYNHS